MSTFILACAGLILLSGVFYLFARTRSGGEEEDLARANLEWYRLRGEELAVEGDEALQKDARLRLLEDEPSPRQLRQEVAVTGQQSFPVWVLMPLIALLSTALYYHLGAAPDVMIARQMHSGDSAMTAEQIRSLIQDIEVRSVQRPGNLHYTALLGRYYMGQEDYSRAAALYGELAIAAPQDAQALAYAAQAEYLAAGRSLSAGARLRAEQALGVDPHQRTALGLLGMASFEKQQYRAAIEYWQRLLAMESPGSDSAQMIAEVIESARQRLGETVAKIDSSGEEAVVATAAVEEPTATAGVTVHVSAPDGAAISPTDTVFVLARNAGSDSRMPIAVQRLSGAQLPFTLRLDDSNSMAGQKLSTISSVIVAVQVSSDGRPGEDNASWLGQIGPLTPSLAGEPIEIRLQRR